nr:hypothetical protein ISGA_3734 [Gordonia sp. NB41Y]
MRTFRLLRVLSAAVLLTVLGASSALAAPTPQGSAPEPVCAWQFMSNANDLNVAFPDSNATYWVMPYALGPGDSISLSGQFPQARYFSLNTYGTDFDTIDTLRDNQITPDRGSSNPFAEVSPAQAGRSWHAAVVPGPADASRNQISGLPTSGTQRVPVGFLIVRVYVPDDPNSPNGGVALPTMTMHLGGATIPLRPCASPLSLSGDSAPMKALFDRLVTTGGGSATEAVFTNPTTTGGLFPNGDNKYLAAPVTYRPGRVVVVRGKAPSFPDTTAGTSPAAARDLRYWSMCQNDRVSPYPVVTCAADHQTALDADGYYTYVIAAPQDLAAPIDASQTLIGWGSTAVADKVLIMRNMLPSAGFYPRSVQASQADHSDPATSMGAYYPRGTYCQVDVLRSQGWQGCYR